MRQNRLTNARSEWITQKSLEASVNQFHADQRAWVGLRDIACDDCPMEAKPRAGHLPDNISQTLNVSVAIKNLIAHLVNTGKIPAENVHVKYVIHVGMMP